MCFSTLHMSIISSYGLRLSQQLAVAHLQKKAVCRSSPRAKEDGLQRWSAPPRASPAVVGSRVQSEAGEAGGRRRARARRGAPAPACRSLRRRPAASPRSGTRATELCPCHRGRAQGASPWLRALRTRRSRGRSRAAPRTGAPSALSKLLAVAKGRRGSRRIRAWGGSRAAPCAETPSAPSELVAV
jgi:hypothetical protein